MSGKPLNASFSSQSILTLTRLATELADRFERLAPGEDGNIDPDDKKLLERVRKQIQKVQSEPMRKLMSAK
jgi:hypothetical protein